MLNKRDQECVSEFICFITSEASDRCQQEKRKTINGEDILWAMSTLGFEHYAEAMKMYPFPPQTDSKRCVCVCDSYLAKYRETTKIERAGIKDGSDDPSVNLMNAAAGGSNGPTQGLDGVLYAGGGGRHHHLPHAYLGQGGGGSGGGGGVGGGGGHHIYYGGV